MSEQINKVLASTAQAFSEAEQAQARANIGAQATLSYTYDGSTITGIDGSAIGGGISNVYAGNCISGSGTSGSPLGLSSSVSLTAGPYYQETYASAGHITVSSKFDGFADVTVYKDPSSYNVINQTGISVMHTASGIGDDRCYSHYGETFDIQYNAGQYYLKRINVDASGIRFYSNGTPGYRSVYGFGTAKYTDDGGVTWEEVSPEAIRRWNSATAGAVSAGNCISGNGSSGSPLGISSVIQIVDGTSAASMSKRGLTVSVDSSRTAWYYAAFASFERDTATGNYYADRIEYSNASGTGLVDYSSIYRWNHPSYYCIIKRPGANTTITVTTASYPTGLTANARMDIVNLGDTSLGYNYIIYDRNSTGGTRTLHAGESGTIWWDASVSAWTEQGE